MWYVVLVKAGKRIFLFLFPPPDEVMFAVLDTVSVWSVTGHRAFLPCDLRPPSRSEQVYLVLWYRGDEGEPIYRSETPAESW